MIDDITDKPGLIQLLWPNGKREGADARRIAGKGSEPGGSAVVFLSTGQVFDHNGGEKYDLVDVIMDRYQLDHKGAAEWLRQQGFLPDRTATHMTTTPLAWAEPKLPDDPNPITRVAHCTHLPGNLSLEDCYRMNAWVPAQGKKVAFPWKHSLGDATGGTVRIARFGGTSAAGGDRRESKIRPWMTRQECLDTILEAKLQDARPTFCLSGDADCPADHDVLVLDMDYKPHLDPDGLGAAVRDMVADAMAREDAAVFASTSGNGRHVVARLTAGDVQTGKRHYRGIPTEAHIAGQQEPGKPGTWHGLRIEIFPAGTRRHIVWHVERKLAGPADSEPLGRIGLDQIARAVWKAMQTAQVAPDHGASPEPEPESVPVSYEMAICENADCRRQFPIGPISLARMEAGQPVVCRRCDAAVQMTQADRIEAAAAEPVPESPPDDAPQTDGVTTWCRRHSLVSIGPECTDCLQGKPSQEARP